MAALDELRDLPFDRGNVFSGIGLGVENADNVHAGVILYEAERNDDGFALNVRETERLRALDENADDLKG